MTTNSAIVIHKYDNSILYVKSKTDLSQLLGVSMSTIMRTYKQSGCYDTDIYKIHIGVETYDNGKQTNYNKDVLPPTVKTYNNTKRIDTANNVVKVTTPSRNSIHNIVDNKPNIAPSINKPIETIIERIDIPKNDVTMNSLDDFLGHNVVIDDWKEIKDNLQPYEYESYYQTQTVEQLWSSYERYKFSDKPRAAIIKRIGEQKQLD